MQNNNNNNNNFKHPKEVFSLRPLATIEWDVNLMEMKTEFPFPVCIKSYLSFTKSLAKEILRKLKQKSRLSDFSRPPPYLNGINKF